MRSTDGNGSATFDKVSTGRYLVRVSGPDIETTTTDLIEVGGAAGGPFITENIQVKLIEAAVQTGGPAIAPIIPDAAQKEFKLGSKEMDKKR
jgi:hypothetical protein